MSVTSLVLVTISSGVCYTIQIGTTLPKFARCRLANSLCLKYISVLSSYRHLSDERSPSWSEVSMFVNFLTAQLDDCEHSCFTDRSIIGHSLPGFKEFIIRFIIIMSKVI